MQGGQGRQGILMSRQGREGVLVSKQENVCNYKTQHTIIGLVGLY